MKFEISNPSDKAYMDAPDLKVAAIAVTLLSRGQYGLTEVDGEASVPMFMLGGAEEWFQDHFKMGIQESYDSLSDGVLHSTLKSVRLAGRRSSLNDIVGRAQKLAERFLGEEVTDV